MNETLISGLTKRFWVNLNGSIQGPMSMADLWELPGFSFDTPVCPEEATEWGPAKDQPAIVQFSFQSDSGDYDPLALESEEPKKFESKNWRAAIIQSDAPEFRSYRAPYQACAVLSQERNSKQAVAIRKGNKAIRFWQRYWKIMLLLVLGFVKVIYASDAPPQTLGQVDPVDIQVIRLTSAPGEAITPLRVIRYFTSVLTHAPMNMNPTPVEFQPIVHAHNSDIRIIAALAYKF
jgi:hypothetical protein